MDEILETFAQWRQAGRNVATATIVHVQGSALPGRRLSILSDFPIIK